MLTSTVTYLGDLRTECRHVRSDSAFYTDAPVDNNGKGESISPTDMCATALASCALSIMAMSAGKQGIDLTGARADVTKHMGIGPRRIVKIEVAFHIPGANLSQEVRNALMAEVDNCPVCHSLHPDIQRVISFNWV
ncbi:OsmC family protein [Desulfovibrio cuneatus]|uniref:OsmC family protein n=1 Tax=Desulfovibrio cuneatus TaxID=159728 RepID=UPI00042235D5|nr:OsmC family protein [Desulfovibrio cuneatus]